MFINIRLDGAVHSLSAVKVKSHRPYRTCPESHSFSKPLLDFYLPRPVPQVTVESWYLSQLHYNPYAKGWDKVRGSSEENGAPLRKVEWIPGGQRSI